MDKKWRNLIIVIALLVVIVLGYLVLTQTSILNPVEDQTNADKEYLVLASLFELSDVNVLLFRENDLLKEDSNNFSLAYSKEKLSTLSADLNDIRVWSKGELNAQKYAKFSSLIDIYQAEIQTNIVFYDFINNFSNVTSSNQTAIKSTDEAIFCEYVGNNYPKFTIDISNVSDLMIDLSEKNYKYEQDYNIVIIDYDFDSSWNNLNSVWNSIYDDLNYCDQKGLIK